MVYVHLTTLVFFARRKSCVVRKESCLRWVDQTGSVGQAIFIDKGASVQGPVYRRGENPVLWNKDETAS